MTYDASNKYFLVHFDKLAVNIAKCFLVDACSILILCQKNADMYSLKQLKLNWNDWYKDTITVYYWKVLEGFCRVLEGSRLARVCTVLNSFGIFWKWINFRISLYWSQKRILCKKYTFFDTFQAWAIKK